MVLDQSSARSLTSMAQLQTSQCTSPQIFMRIGLKYKNLATKASRTAHPSTEFKAHTHSSHPPHLTSQTPPWTYKIHDPNMSNLFPELRTFSRQFTDSQHVHTYSRYKNLQIHSLPNKTVLQIPKCPSQGEPFLYVSLRYNCRQL